jgi:hypothetical protein
MKHLTATTTILLFLEIRQILIQTTFHNNPKIDTLIINALGSNNCLVLKKVYSLQTVNNGKCN